MHISKADPVLLPATLQDHLVIQNMARFYVYEMAGECGLQSDGWALPTDGLYEAFDFKPYLESSNRNAYLIKVNNELAGFVLINNEGLLSETEWNMGEFFVIRRFQGRNIGHQIMAEVLTRHPGHWEVSVIPENNSALNFWRKTITKLTSNQFQETIMIVDYDPEQPERIIFSFLSK